MRKILLTLTFAAIALAQMPVDAWGKVKFRLLYSFKGGADGFGPSDMIRDDAGNLYGATPGGTGCGGGCGTLFKLAPDGTKTVLYDFEEKNKDPNSDVLLDSQGNFFGTTASGGRGCFDGCGTVFKLAADGTETDLHLFRKSEGDLPAIGLISDTSGNFYGTTARGGNGCGHGGCGTVFKLAPDGTYAVLHAFAGGADGQEPEGLVLDSAGNIYGETYSSLGASTVFRIAPDGSETVLYTFAGNDDGHFPSGRLILDAAGNLYGTTRTGGSGFVGTVFKLTPDGTKTLLHGFAGGRDGADPVAGVIADANGNLYGTTLSGGGSGCSDEGCGTVFKLAPDGTETILHRFRKAEYGYQPAGRLTMDQNGDLFGTTFRGGSSDSGTIFEIMP
jgi:uncharacterized repeat protein (TIGR03803 family)